MKFRLSDWKYSSKFPWLVHIQEILKKFVERITFSNKISMSEILQVSSRLDNYLTRFRILNALCSSSAQAALRRSLTSQVISVAFYIDREKSDRFCSEALISASGSFSWRKSTTRDQRLNFPPEGSFTQDFYALKKYIDPGRVWTREPRMQWRVWWQRDHRGRLHTLCIHTVCLKFGNSFLNLLHKDYKWYSFHMHVILKRNSTGLWCLDFTANARDYLNELP